ncbi:MAG: monovalent cation/H+ antiporter complex subunit F [Chloroflexi bacterium]|nr:monovalent cation/H+ antiporter complex subunit F [Chloroflexota bacterium]MDA1240841.1 monovalent cation/H+ antiporter complex subunit F [Chloroflexota bacterium]
MIGDAAFAVRTVAEIIIVISLLLSLLFLWVAKSLLDRVIALEVIAAVTVAGAAMLAITDGDPAMLDVALAVALVSFTGTVAFASFVERRRPDD